MLDIRLLGVTSDLGGSLGRRIGRGGHTESCETQEPDQVVKVFV